MNKKVIAIICAMIIGAMIFASCSAQGTNENTTAPPTEQASDTLTPVDAQVGAEEKPTDTASTEAAATEMAADEPADNKEQSEAQKPTEATTKKPKATTKKETTTKKPVTTTKKAATTKKPTTTKKHVTPQQVQAEVNAYIKSRGITLNEKYYPLPGRSDEPLMYDPEDPNHIPAGWTNRESAAQKDIDRGYSLRACKEEVDSFFNKAFYPQGPPKEAYCYYDATEEFFYILW